MSTSRGEAICYARPVPSSHLSHLVAIQGSNDELRSRVEELEEENRLLHSEVACLRADQHAHLETIRVQADEFQSCQQRILALDDELRLCESQRKLFENESASKAIRILDLERNVSTLTSELLESESQQRASSQRLADMAREVSTLQQRLGGQKETNDRLERQFIAIQANNPVFVHDDVPSNARNEVALSCSAPQARATEAPAIVRGQRRSDQSYDLATQLESELLDRSQQRDIAQSKLLHLENQKLRTIAEKARKDALTHEVSVLSSEISDIRKQLRSMNQLFK